MLKEVFHQVFAQEDIWFGRCWMKIPKWQLSAWPSLMIEWGDFSYF